jgi:hypothetical protein
VTVRVAFNYSSHLRCVATVHSVINVVHRVQDKIRAKTNGSCFIAFVSMLRWSRLGDRDIWLKGKGVYHLSNVCTLSGVE